MILAVDGLAVALTFMWILAGHPAVRVKWLNADVHDTWCWECSETVVTAIILPWPLLVGDSMLPSQTRVFLPASASAWIANRSSCKLPNGNSSPNRRSEQYALKRKQYLGSPRCKVALTKQLIMRIRCCIHLSSHLHRKNYRVTRISCSSPVYNPSFFFHSPTKSL
jgi:hypothetical protein